MTQVNGGGRVSTFTTLYEWMNEWMKSFILLSCATFMNENNNDNGNSNVSNGYQWLHTVID